MSLAVFFAPVMEQGAFIHSIQPLMANFKSMAHLLEPSSITSVLTFTCVLPSLLGGFCVAIYAASRHMYALSRAGILPTPLSLTFHGAPLYSVILALTFALVAVCITEISKALTAPTTLTQRTHDATIKIGTWVASIGYMIVCGSYIYLRVRMANLPRPFTSPFCITGALLSLLISGFFGVVGPVYFDGFFYYILATVFVVVAVLFLPYYWLVALPRLSDAPEKMFVRRQIHRLYGSQKVHRPSMSFDFQTAIDKTKIISILKLDSTKIISQTPPPSSDIV
ncbi:hypothetical protein HMI54_000652 [Coelomomyces lativittatus]|nr:hypothetical protein HMI54_000652 [Coelomomyces lativittatus]KAJ1515413.1 hypothetical protein HMI55_003719 [Coelomomyces lativittatus]